MATMLQEQVETFSTEGEKQFYTFLAAAAKPDARYLAWYTPDIRGREPDFVLYSDDIGLVIFEVEVKDWKLRQIEEMDPKEVRLRVGSRLEVRKNPAWQAKEYTYHIMDAIRQDGRLLSREPEHHGKPKVPIHYGMVFPNINKDEYLSSSLDSVIDTNRVFFWDDLNPASELCTDKSGARFHATLSEKFPPHFKFQLNHSDMNRLKQLIFPTVRIELPGGCPCAEQEEMGEALRLLDRHQEALARKFDGKHRILTGPSGTGKTLILVHKAACLLRYNHQIKRILFVCYNVTLVNYIKRLLGAKQIPLGQSGVRVMHFYELCSEILGEEVAYEKEDADYYEMVCEETLARLKASPVQYDAILVDEGQDFSDAMYHVVTQLLNPATNKCAKRSKNSCH